MITNYLNKKGFYDFELYDKESVQVDDLILLTRSPNINVMKIGFDSGQFADLLLINNKDLNLTSFDSGEKEYTLSGKEYIDIVYPNKHKLILGDINLSIIDFMNNNNNKFDIIFIDNNRDYHLIILDIDNCFHLSHKDTIIIILNTNNQYHNFTNYDSIKVWNYLIQHKKIIELDKKEYYNKKGIFCGKFNM